MFVSLIARMLAGGAIAVVLGHSATNGSTRRGEQPLGLADSGSIRATAITSNGSRVAAGTHLTPGVGVTITAVGFTPGGLVSLRQSGAASVVQRVRAGTSGSVRFNCATSITVGAHRLIMEQDGPPSVSGEGNVAVSVPRFAILAYRN